MKKLQLISIPLILFCFQAFTSQAQQVKQGVEIQKGEGTISTINQKLENKYFTGFSFQLRKGFGYIFFIQSNDFEPVVGIYEKTSQQYLGVAGEQEVNGKKEFYVSYISNSDLPVDIIFSTGKDNQTGSFEYGCRILEPSQMAFTDSLDVCNKLNYLFNHWQLNWKLIESEEFTEFDEKATANNYRATYNTLFNKSKARITPQYEEEIYSKKETMMNLMGSKSLKLLKQDTLLAADYYKKVCGDLITCLDQNKWKTETEEFKGKSGKEQTIFYTVTHFIARDAVRNEKGRSFKVIYSHSYSTPSKVIITFN